jgi:predicted dehydrogenase/threonine dehydrogenase-like Zn-dependent dehydrogenase
MKQVVQNFRTGQLTVDELPPPALKRGGVLVRTAYSLISAGTERSTVETAKSSLIGKARSRPDLVRQVLGTLKREGLVSTYNKVKARLNQVKALGYSASGIVIEIGEGVTGLAPGDRVACAGAGYASHAEVIFVPRNLCATVPDGVPLESACYTTVGAIALHGVRQADARLGETAAVIGLGLVGQLTVQLLKAAGCHVIGIDIDPAACELAKLSGADLVASDPAAARAACDSLTAGRGADCILITAGTKSNDPIELAAELARDRARVVAVGLVGLDIPRNVFYAKEIELRLSRSYGPGRYDPQYEENGVDYPVGYVRWTERRNMEAFLSLMADGKINTGLLTTHAFPIARADEAYDLILGRMSLGDGESATETAEQEAPTGSAHNKPGSLRCGVVLQYPDEVDIRQQTLDIRRPSVSVTENRLPGRARASGELGVSFIGPGNFARGVLLPLLRRAGKVRLAGVAAATGVSAKNAASEFGFSYSTTDYSRLLDDEDTDCVFIATRHDLHSRLAAECLARGKPVFVEKPLATSIEGLCEVMDQANTSAGVLAVGYNRRFAPLAAQVKERLSNRAGPLSISYRVNAGQLPPEHWSHDRAEGGGRIIGEVCHFIDFAQYITGALPMRVNAEPVPQSRRAGFPDDSVAISISMTDGSIASIFYVASGDALLPKERIEIFCDRSVAIIDDFKSAEFIRDGKSSRLGRGGQDKGHAAEIQAFLRAARGEAEWPIKIDSTAATSLATFAALESIRTATAAVVDLSALRADTRAHHHFED